MDCFNFNAMIKQFLKKRVGYYDYQLSDYMEKIADLEISKTTVFMYLNDEISETNCAKFFRYTEVEEIDYRYFLCEFFMYNKKLILKNAFKLPKLDVVLESLKPKDFDIEYVISTVKVILQAKSKSKLHEEIAYYGNSLNFGINLDAKSGFNIHKLLKYGNMKKNLNILDFRFSLFYFVIIALYIKNLIVNQKIHL